MVVMMLWAPAVMATQGSPEYDHALGTADDFGGGDTREGYYYNVNGSDDTSAYVEGMLYLENNKAFVADWWLNMTMEGNGMSPYVVADGGNHDNKAEGFIMPGHDIWYSLEVYLVDLDGSFDTLTGNYTQLFWYDGGDDDGKNSSYWSHYYDLSNNQSTSWDLGAAANAMENWAFGITWQREAATDTWNVSAMTGATAMYYGDISEDPEDYLLQLNATGSDLVADAEDIFYTNITTDARPLYKDLMFQSTSFDPTSGGQVVRLAVNFTIGEQIHRSNAAAQTTTGIPLAAGQADYETPYTTGDITAVANAYPISSNLNQAGMMIVENQTYNDAGSWNIACQINDVTTDDTTLGSNDGGLETPLGEMHVYAATTLEITDTTPYGSGDPTDTVTTTNFGVTYSANGPNYFNITLEDHLYRTDWAAAIEWIESDNVSARKPFGNDYQTNDAGGLAAANGALADHSFPAGAGATTAAFGKIPTAIGAVGVGGNTTLTYMHYTQGPRQFQKQSWAAANSNFDITIPANTLGGTYMAGLTWTVEQYTP